MLSSASARRTLVALAIIPLPMATATSAQLASAARDVLFPPEAGEVSGPAGTSGTGNSRYDAVGLARWQAKDGVENRDVMGEMPSAAPIVGAHAQLSPGSVVEVTALDSGRTILVLIDRATEPGEKGAEIVLSPSAASLLGFEKVNEAPVRVRGVAVSANDLAALKGGRPAAKRLDAPLAVLVALRQQLRAATPPTNVVAVSKRAPAPRVAVPTPAARASVPVDQARSTSPMPTPTATTIPAQAAAAPRQASSGKYLVQVAALSDPARARSLAESLKGFVESTAQLHRVRLGPFADRDSAQRARDAAQRRGYGDATILTQP